jgi:ABC-2 type transport system permease protein
MILSAAYIGIVTILEAGPVYMVFMAGIKGYKLAYLQWIWVIGSFLVAFLLSILAVILPMKFGEKKLVVFQR